MKPRNVEDLLKQVSPPDVALPTSKAKLRHELLQSDHFKRKPLRQRFFKYALRLAPVMGLFLLLILFKFMPDEMSAVERIEHLETAYRSGLVSDMVHYLKVQSSEVVDEKSKIILQQWRYGKDMLRILLQYENNDNIVGHMILKGERAFLWLDKTSEAKICISRQPDKEISPGETKEKHVSRAYSSQVIPVKNQPTDDPNKKQVCAIISRDSFDIFGLAASDPTTILTRLKNSPTVIYSGTEKNGNRSLELFERRTSDEIRAFLIDYDKKLEKDAEAVLVTLVHQETLGSSQGYKVLAKGFRIETVDVREITKVDKATGMITSISYQAFRKGKMLAEHRLNFLKEQFVPYRRALFDEHLFRLEEYNLGEIPETKQ
jgi:hypothetical protein